MSRLDAVDDGLWTATTPLRLFGLIEIGTRMTVVRLGNGGLWVHSPIVPDQELRAELDMLGPVRQIVAPNRYHHLFAGPFREAYPEARLWVAPGLPRKRSDLQYDALLEESAPAEWSADLDQVPVESLLGETVFHHRPTRTLISSDLIANLHGRPGFLTWVYARWAGVWRQPGVPPTLKLAYRNKERARRDLERVLEWDFDRLILAHGEIVAAGGRQVLRDSFAWLLDRRPEAGRSAEPS